MFEFLCTAKLTVMGEIRSANLFSTFSNVTVGLQHCIMQREPVKLTFTNFILSYDPRNMLLCSGEP